MNTLLIVFGILIAILIIGRSMYFVLHEVDKELERKKKEMSPEEYAKFIEAWQERSTQESRYW